jgi:hypothetical protein
MLWNMFFIVITVVVAGTADSGGRSVEGAGLRPFACSNCGFDFRSAQGCLSALSVLCGRVEVSAPDRSLVWRIPTECYVSDCDLQTSAVRKTGPLGAVEPIKNYYYYYYYYYYYQHHHNHQYYTIYLFNFILLNVATSGRVKFRTECFKPNYLTIFSCT